MAKIEILAYCPMDMNEFIDYFVNGIKDNNGNTIKDEDDREVTGVIAWLHGREIPEAHFFSSAPEDPVQLFMAVIQPTEDEDVPWIGRVPGFKRMVRDDGKIGDADGFSAAGSAGNSPLGFVKPRPDLDTIFRDEKQRIASIDFTRVPFTKDTLLRTLQGKRGTNLSKLLGETNSRLNLNILQLRTEFQVSRA